MTNELGFVGRVLDWCTNTAHKLLDKGYTRAWFDWLQWIIITGLIIYMAVKSNSYSLLLVGAVSAVLVFFSGLAGVERLVKQIMSGNKAVTVYSLFITALISAIGLVVVINVFFDLLPASIKFK